MSEQNISPAAAAPPEAQMSTPETLTGIFFEPGRTFTALRERPRFLVAALISIVAFMAFYLTYIQRIGYERVIDSEVSVAKKTQTGATEEQIEQGAVMQRTPVVKVIRMWSPILVLLAVIAAGAGLYQLGTNLMGGRLSYRQALSVWAYSSMPPLVLMTILNLVLLFVNTPDNDEAIAQGLNRGLVRANPGAFVDATANPVLAAALGSLDVLAFYGLFLGALGLRKVGRLSSGSAWTVVLLLWGVGVLVRIVMAAAFGRG